MNPRPKGSSAPGFGLVFVFMFNLSRTKQAKKIVIYKTYKLKIYDSRFYFE